MFPSSSSSSASSLSRLSRSIKTGERRARSFLTARRGNDVLSAHRCTVPPRLATSICMYLLIHCTLVFPLHSSSSMRRRRAKSRKKWQFFNVCPASSSFSKWMDRRMEQSRKSLILFLHDVENEELTHVQYYYYTTPLLYWQSSPRFRDFRVRNLSSAVMRCWATSISSPTHSLTAAHHFLLHTKMMTSVHYFPRS